MGPLYLYYSHNVQLKPPDDIYGSGSSVGIANDYELDGRGSNPGGDEIFRSSRPLLAPRPWKSRAITLPTLWGHTGPVMGSLYLYIII